MSRIVAYFGCTVLCSTVVPAQTPISAGLQRFHWLVEQHAVGKSWPCFVRPARTQLGFDLGFRTGYAVRIRLRDLAGKGGRLTTIFRVTPQYSPDKPTHFVQEWTVPPIAEGSHGDVWLDGTFTIGSGNYKVDWLMRDWHGGVCSASWTLSPRLPHGAGHIATAFPRGAVLASGEDQAAQAQPRDAKAIGGLHLAVLVHAGSNRAGAWSVSDEDRDRILSILRTIGREPRVRSFSVLAFNLETTRILYKETETSRIDMAELNSAMKSLRLGTIALDELATEGAEAQFLTDVAGNQDFWGHADALVFVGPKCSLDQALTDSMRRQLGSACRPVFYLSYGGRTLHRDRDPISAAVRHWRGNEFNLGKPLDLVSAWSRIMSRLGNGQARTAARLQD
jgi:hypothetical protein